LFSKSKSKDRSLRQLLQGDVGLLAEIQKSLADASADPSLDSAHSFHAAEFSMNYLISLAIGLGVGLLYGALDFRSPAPPAIALVGLLGMLAGEQLWPMGRQLVAGWLS
jgi:XapX domain-containing protein